MKKDFSKNMVAIISLGKYGTSLIVAINENSMVSGPKGEKSGKEIKGISYGRDPFLIKPFSGSEMMTLVLKIPTSGALILIN
jgi:hypothetical protein